MKNLVILASLFVAQSAFASLALDITELSIWNNLPPNSKGLFHMYAVREVLLPNQTPVHVVTFDSGAKSVIPEIVPSRAILLNKEEMEIVSSFLKEAYLPDGNRYQINQKNICGSESPGGQVFTVKGAANKAGITTSCNGGVSSNAKKVIETLDQAIKDSNRETLESAQKSLQKN